MASCNQLTYLLFTGLSTLPFWSCGCRWDIQCRRSP